MLTKYTQHCKRKSNIANYRNPKLPNAVMPKEKFDIYKNGGLGEIKQWKYFKKKSV